MGKRPHLLSNNTRLVVWGGEEIIFWAHNNEDLMTLSPLKGFRYRVWLALMLCAIVGVNYGQVYGVVYVQRRHFESLKLMSSSSLCKHGLP